MKEYKVENGTFYNAKTPIAIVSVLEKARLTRTRLHISLGDATTGSDWLEENDVFGFVGRSTGPIKVPLLIHNQRSLGGGAILDRCIVRIRASAGGQVLYQHPNYHHGTLEILQKVQPVVLEDGRSLLVNVLRDGKLQAAFETVAKAMRYVQKFGLTLS